MYPLRATHDHVKQRIHRYIFTAWLTAAPLTLLWAADDGDYSRHLILQEGRKLEVLISDRYETAMRENLLQWVDYISTALDKVYGHWPDQRWQISAVPANATRRGDPIPWAQVHRDEVNRIEFFTANYASVDQLKTAWTGYHELAHLLIPYRGWGDSWFSEGLASYYQNVLQARMGLISEQQMWQKLYDGFQRGLAQTRFDDQTLRSVSDNLRQNGGFMRVYWSGAWYFLAADTRLRLQSGGKLNLDTVLAQLNACCGDQRLSVPQIVAQLDQLTQLQLFDELYQNMVDSKRIPPFEGIFASMGIDVIDDRIHLQEQGPGARLRREIATGSDISGNINVAPAL